MHGSEGVKSRTVEVNDRPTTENSVSHLQLDRMDTAALGLAPK